MHNALHQVTLRTPRHTLAGFSIAGLATYVQVPDLDVCFDMGECPLSAVAIRHVLLTHAHGDHSRCLLRHRALREMLGLGGSSTYFMPHSIVPAFLEMARAEARFEGVSDERYLPPPIVGLVAGGTPVQLPQRPDLAVQAFAVVHGVDSLGYTILQRRQKLKAEHKDRPGADIAALRKAGVDVQDVVFVPLLTFIGDCIAQSLIDQDHIWLSPVLVIEASFVTPGEEQLACDKGHTHLRDIGQILGARLNAAAAVPEVIVLKHFSMKHSRAEIEEAVQREIPAALVERIQLLLPPR